MIPVRSAFTACPPVPSGSPGSFWKRPFQLLVYAVRIWERFRRVHPEATRLPALVPVVVHHSETGWNSGTQLLDLFDLDEATRPHLVSLLPNLRFLLDDLATASSEELYSRTISALGRLALFCLQRARSVATFWKS